MGVVPRILLSDHLEKEQEEKMHSHVSSANLLLPEVTPRSILLRIWNIKTKTRTVHFQVILSLGCFRSKVSTCLLVTDPRSQYAVRLPHKLPGMHYSANEQCQILFGTNATFCRNMEVSSRGWAGSRRGTSLALAQQVWL
jgi:hypothetical protein